MRYCVIGGAGFIGRYVVKQMLAMGKDLRVIGRSATRPAELDGAVFYMSGDFGDKAFLEKALEGVDGVVDLAYSTVPKSSFDNPIYDIQTNLPQVVNLYQVAAESPSIRKLVVVSSGGTVYGAPTRIPINEEHQTNPISPYGITKLAVEKYGLMYHHLFHLPVTIVRPSNAFGEGQLPYRGQGFIATAIATLLKGDVVTIYGGDQIVRDYIHVSDVASGIVAALESGHIGVAYNIGTGIGLTTNEVFKKICELARQTGKTVRSESMPMRAFDVPVNILDCQKLEMDTGWRPQVGFDEGLERVWRWFLGRPATVYGGL